MALSMFYVPCQPVQLITDSFSHSLSKYLLNVYVCKATCFVLCFYPETVKTDDSRCSPNSLQLSF